MARGQSSEKPWTGKKSEVAEKLRRHVNEILKEISFHLSWEKVLATYHPEKVAIRIYTRRWYFIEETLVVISPYSNEKGIYKIVIDFNINLSHKVPARILFEILHYPAGQSQKEEVTLEFKLVNEIDRKW
jgi:hypothetical protein